MINFGYTLNKSGAINLVEADLSLYNDLMKKVPSFARCIGCGGCAATCAARQHTDFSVLKCNMLIRRGEYDTLSKELNKCMLCGKCSLVCPRNVNTRAMIIQARLLVNSFSKR